MLKLDVCLTLLVLLTCANGAPVIAKRLLGDRWAAPVDGGLMLSDGMPLFGKSKTARGIAVAILATTLGATMLGFDWLTGFVFGLCAMLGDLFSSFVKRRMGLTSSSRATGLDQIPEALFPLLATRVTLDLSMLEIVVTVGGFLVGEIVLSRVLYRLHIRDRPH